MTIQLIFVIRVQMKIQKIKNHREGKKRTDDLGSGDSKARFDICEIV